MGCYGDFIGQTLNRFGHRCLTLRCKSESISAKQKNAAGTKSQRDDNLAPLAKTSAYHDVKVRPDVVSDFGRTAIVC